jgi:serine/threonine-protein kinase
MYPPLFQPLEIGSRFSGRFRIVRLIGAGGMGAVYEAESLKGLANRAIKVLRQPPELKEEKFRELFCLEATILCKLPQDHVVQVFDFGLDETTKLPFIEMEMLRGENLSARVRPGRGLPPEYLLMLLGQTARTLDVIHDRGVVHRDIKPENLVVVLDDNLEPTIKIIDFGIAKTVTTGANPATTGLKGTPWYVAPEQIIGKNLSGATDRYALAQVAFTLLTGEPYWSGTHEYSHNLAQMFLAMDQRRCLSASERVRLLNERLAESYGFVEPVVLPPGFDDWFTRATEFEPQQRFSSAGEMIDKLATLLLGARSLENHVPYASPVAAPLQIPSPISPVAAQPGSYSALVESNQASASNNYARTASIIGEPFRHSPKMVSENISPAESLHPRKTVIGSRQWVIALAVLGVIILGGSMLYSSVLRPPSTELAALAPRVVSSTNEKSQLPNQVTTNNVAASVSANEPENPSSAGASPAVSQNPQTEVNFQKAFELPNGGASGKRTQPMVRSSAPLRAKLESGGTGNTNKSNAVNPVDELR